jgi:mono/diheme cytochrome c family protein
MKMKASMKKRIAVLAGIPLLASVLWAAAPAGNSNSPAPTALVASTDNSAAMRLEGEKRFRTNCGRCHAAPHKFPPRMMATIVRHMRVRATITDEDMRFVLYYMTQ